MYTAEYCTNSNGFDLNLQTNSHTTQPLSEHIQTYPPRYHIPTATAKQLPPTCTHACARSSTQHCRTSPPVHILIATRLNVVPWPPTSAAESRGSPCVLVRRDRKRTRFVVIVAQLFDDVFAYTIPIPTITRSLVLCVWKGEPDALSEDGEKTLTPRTTATTTDVQATVNEIASHLCDTT